MSGPGERPRGSLLGVLSGKAKAAGARPYLVGGAVRDRLLARAPVDEDVAVEGPVCAVSSVVTALLETGWRCEARHDRFGTATLRDPAGERFDLAVTRQELYPHPGALPVVTPGVPIGRDLARRDFTIHAMAFPLGENGIEDSLLDPFGGATDLGLRCIRLLHDGSLADDPTRVFRAARYAARLGFGLDTGFGIAMQRGVASGAFAKISGDRLRRALDEVLSEENRGVAMDVLDRLGAPAAVAAGWKIGPAALRNLAEAASKDDAWATLLEPVPPELRERIAARLNFSRALRRTTGCRR